MKQYRITITVHRDAESSERAAIQAAAELAPAGGFYGSILAQNVDSPCDCTFLGIDPAKGEAA